MNSRTIQLAIVVAVVLACTSSLAAQTTTKDTLLFAHIPFAFVAGGVHLPAGDYQVYHPGNPYVIVIEKSNYAVSAIAYVHPSGMNGGETSTKLVFNRYGDQYFLGQVWTERNREVHESFKGQAEKQLVAQSQKATSVAIAAVR